MAVRTAILEIQRLTDRSKNKERRETWEELANHVKVATNYYWRCWWKWHEDNNSEAAVRTWHAKIQEWHKKPKKGRGRKPVCKVKAVPPELAGPIYHKLVKEMVSTIAPRTIALLLSSLSSLTIRKKSNHGVLPWWMNALMYETGMCNSTKPQPVPIANNNIRLIPPESENGNWLLEFRIEREREQKLIRDMVELRTKGYKCRRTRQILSRAHAGVYQVATSLLVTKKNKWFVHLCYQMPEQVKPALDASKKAIFFPGRKDPWMLKFDGEVEYRGGTGRHIAALRRRCTLERRERQESYKWAGSAQRGHGRKRAIQGWTRLRNIWTNVCTNYTRHVCKAIVDECVAKGIGTLIYWQPVERHAETRFLTTAGKQPDVNDSTSYPYFQVGVRLKQLCQERGIAFDVVQMGKKCYGEKAA